jgi:Fanconi anemia group M protein
VFIKHRFIKPNSVEYRKFQVAIAYSSRKANSLVVLPTGLGKTIIALFLIAEKLDLKNEKILFLAPTKPLVMQHAQFLKEFLTIDPETISVFTGEISPDKRKKLWDSSKIIVSTPQVIENDILSKRIFLKDICLIVFDESHHAVGEYAYVFVAEVYRKQREKGHILAMTASPGNDVSKIIEVCRNLDITNIEIRTKYDPDVRPYVHELKISWKEIPLPKEFSYTLQLLRKALSSRLKMLKEIGAIESSSINQISRTKLLDAQTKIQMQIRCQVRPSKALFNAASTQSEALKIHYAIELLQTQGVNAIKSYFERVIKEASSKGSSKSSRSIMRDNNVLESIAYLRSLDDLLLPLDDASLITLSK